MQNSDYNKLDRTAKLFFWIFVFSFMILFLSVFTGKTYFSISNHSFSIPMLLTILILVSSWVLFVWKWKGDVPLYIKNKRNSEVIVSKHGKTFISLLIFIFLILISYFAIIVPINS